MRISKPLRVLLGTGAVYAAPVAAAAAGQPRSATGPGTVCQSPGTAMHSVRHSRLLIRS
jgi:hypothetical protein